jgi:uncharacterized repeat protein (TIGR03803 family)
MDKGIQFGLTLTKPIRISILSMLLVLAGRTFNTSGQTETNLHSFVGSIYDGSIPTARLVQGSDGSFYGTTRNGGRYNDGTVFRISPTGVYTNVYSFDIDGTPTDGQNPFAGLVQGSDGNFYGTTFIGGTNSDGTVFRISPGGSETTLYQFSCGSDGANPYYGRLVQGSDSDFYGTTAYGGTNSDGTVFKITSAGTMTTLHEFNSSGGNEPLGDLVQGSDGDFYGTTYGGGTNDYGTVFKMTSTGTLTSLYQFSGGSEGQYPESGLVQGNDGNFYGTTRYGGTTNFNGIGYYGYGTLFKITSAGTLTTLHAFNLSDGFEPIAGLVQGSDGDFYGTTYEGGTNGYGTVFKFTSAGTLTTLYQFSGGSDGQYSVAGLVQGSDGNFYGTTSQGGGGANCQSGCGTVFKLTVPLAPPANQISAIQLSGTNFIFSIPSVAYETYQLQFTADLTSGIWSNVPSISVTNSIGALLTLTNFAGANQPQGFYRFDITP